MQIVQFGIAKKCTKNQLQKPSRKKKTAVLTIGDSSVDNMTESVIYRSKEISRQYLHAITNVHFYWISNLRINIKTVSGNMKHGRIFLI